MSDADRKVSDFQDAILSFYERYGRSLPWRETTDVYKVMVSELMLQQTQVSRVKQKYREFLDAFGDAQSLADASQRDVLAIWQGLGYNRRAMYVQNAARLIADTPDPSYDELLEVKGIGPYSAAAIRVFARNEQRAAIDVNVRRVHERFFGSVDDEFIARCVPDGRSCDWHNALMDFGSQVCTKRSPSCQECPLADDCHAFTNDTFGQEQTRSQPRFEGSVRWHRGQLLKKLLDTSKSREQVWQELDEDLRDDKKFSKAIKQLADEGFLSAGEQLALLH